MNQYLAQRNDCIIYNISSVFGHLGSYPPLTNGMYVKHFDLENNEYSGVICTTKITGFIVLAGMT